MFHSTLILSSPENATWRTSPGCSGRRGVSCCAAWRCSARSARRPTASKRGWRGWRGARGSAGRRRTSGTCLRIFHDFLGFFLRMFLFFGFFLRIFRRSLVMTNIEQSNQNYHEKSHELLCDTLWSFHIAIGNGPVEIVCVFHCFPMKNMVIFHIVMLI